MSESAKAIEIFYDELVELVRFSIHQRIDQERIEGQLERLIDVFSKDAYSELLRLSYRESKDNFLYAHIANNLILAVAFATSLGLSQQEKMDVAKCAFGHDFGMMDYHDLFKKPGQLTPEEKQSIYEHPQKSVEIFKTYFSEKVIHGISDVHECVNGKGYPKAKTGGEISYLAKIVSVCDIFEALTHPRPFRKEFSPYAALKMIIKRKDTMFDKLVIKKFVEFISIYPIGSWVRINTGEMGMVVAANTQHPSRSVIAVIADTNNELRFTGKLINLANDPMLCISAVIETNPLEIA